MRVLKGVEQPGYGSSDRSRRGSSQVGASVMFHQCHHCHLCHLCDLWTKPESFDDFRIPKPRAEAPFRTPPAPPERILDCRFWIWDWLCMVLTCLKPERQNQTPTARTPSTEPEFVAQQFSGETPVRWDTFASSPKSGGRLPPGDVDCGSRGFHEWCYEERTSNVVRRQCDLRPKILAHHA
jgi:hypothetical protein